MSTRQAIKYIVPLVLSAGFAFSGCAQWTITGQNSLWKPTKTASQQNPSGCDLIGIYTQNQADNKDENIINVPDAFKVSLKTLYLKYIQDICNFNIIMYAEVYEIDETATLRRVAFQTRNQAPTSYVNISDVLLYGPNSFSGKPVSIKLYVLELDKEDNAFFSEIVKVLSGIAGNAQPQYGPAIQVVSSIMQYIINSNPDDLEFFQEMTFSPSKYAEKAHYNGASLLAPLEVGDYIIAKKEDDCRIAINRWGIFDSVADQSAKKHFDTSEVYYDPKTGKLKYSKDRDEKIKKDMDFTDKTYAVVTVSRAEEAEQKDVLQKISDNTMKTLDQVAINKEMSDRQKKEALQSISANAEAAFELFNIKNSISGTSTASKIEYINKELSKIGTGTTDAEKIVVESLNKLLKQIERGK